MSRTYVIALLVAFLLLGTIGFYIFTSGDNLDDLIAKKGELQGRLAVAQEKLNKAKDKLQSMLEGLKGYFSLAVSVQGQMEEAKKLVRKTDFMFEDPDGENPRIIIAGDVYDPNIELINFKRREINAILKRWGEKNSLSFIGQMDEAESQLIKQEIEQIKAFIESLNQTVAGITPGNSDFSQSEISNFVSQLPQTGAAEEILSTLVVAIAEASHTPVDSGNPPVIPPEIIAQQTVVDDLEEEIEELQEQLGEVEDQIEEQTGGTPPPPQDPPAETVPTSVSETPTTGTGNETPIDLRKKYNTIIIQPGPPKLIQGEDPY